MTDGERELWRAIGARMQRRRSELRLTQEQVAQAVRLSKDHVSRLERGASGAPLWTLAQIAQVLDWTLADLVGGNESASPGSADTARLIAESQRHFAEAAREIAQAARLAQQNIATLIGSAAAAGGSVPRASDVASGRDRPGPGTIRPADRPGVEGAAVPPAPRPAMR
ncbi:MAG: helix-turn-helix domain-containing protein [Bacillota bacterium]|nr:helix-turn-helix domain-containing protein [Bacillota bacterium]